MDQPTNLNITIKGKTADVKRAALAAQRRIDLDTRGFAEEKYTFGDGGCKKVLGWDIYRTPDAVYYSGNRK